MRKRLVGTAVVVSCMTMLLITASATAHGGNPSYRSELRAVKPAIEGVDVQVLNYDDSLALVNQSGKDVLIRGYEREPYARIQADGTVRVNQKSPSYFLNEERYGTQVPPAADPRARPDWKVVSKTGRFEWHDHRIHWMSKEALPPQVTDKDKRTKVFDWRVPLDVGGRPVALTGVLFYVPASSGGIPTAAVAALVALVLVTIALAMINRRVRARRSATS